MTGVRKNETNELRHMAVASGCGEELRLRLSYVSDPDTHVLLSLGFRVVVNGSATKLKVSILPLAPNLKTFSLVSPPTPHD